MANLTAVIVHAKALKNNKNKVRIAVSHNSEVRYIVTNLLVENITEFKNGGFRNRPDAAYMNAKLRKIMQRYQEALDDIDYIEGLSCSELVYLLKHGADSKNKTIEDIYKEYIDVVVKTEGSARAYGVRYNSIVNYLSPNMLMRQINHSTILGLIKYFEKKRLSQMTIRMRLLFLKTLINYAVKCGYCEFKINPFNGIPIPENVIREAWLSEDEIRSIRDYVPKTLKEQRCRDLFMLSYYLGGINLTDLMKIDFNKQRDTIKYMRQKTLRANRSKQYVEFAIPEEAKKIISQMALTNGKISLSDRERDTVCADLFRIGFQRMSNSLGFKMIYYSARKSFAQHAFSLGVNTSIIDYILGHSTNNGDMSLYHYIKVSPEMATKAVRLVLDNLKN